MVLSKICQTKSSHPECGIPAFLITVYLSEFLRTAGLLRLLSSDTAISQNLGSAHFFKFFLRGSQERKDLALNPKRVSLVVGKDQQRTCAVMGRKCRVKPVVPRLPGQTFHWSKSADLWVCVSLSFPGAPRKKKVEKCALPRFCEIAVFSSLTKHLLFIPITVLRRILIQRIYPTF